MTMRKRKSSTAKKSARKKRSATSAKGAAAETEPRCPALLISVGEFTDDDERALALAQSVVERQLGRAWTVAPLGPGARDFRVRRTSGRAIPVGDAWELTRQLQSDRDVADAEPELVGPGLEPHPDELADLGIAGPVIAGGPQGGDLKCTDAPAFAWSLSLCNVQNAWALPVADPTVGKARGEGIVVGHPDTGYTEHDEIWSTDAHKNRVLWQKGRDFFSGAATPLDPLDGKNPGHGTATSSVIMAGADPMAGAHVDGVAPLAKIIPMRVTNWVVLFSFGHLAEALHHAVAADCHVVSISLGGPIKSRTLHRAVQRAVDNGVIVLAAAGNVWPWVVYPARFDEAIAVAACNCSKKAWKSSASGGDVDVTAPGESVWVARTKKNGASLDYSRDRGSGTSFAVATTAGVCALWLAYHGRKALIDKYGAAKLASVFKELVMTAGVNTPPGWDTGNFGAGILDAEKVLKAHLPATPHAAGMRVRASAAPPAVNLLDEIMIYFPGVPRTRVRSGLARFLGTNEAGLQRELREYGDEILFHVATNAYVRSEIRRAPNAPVAASMDTRRRGAARLQRTASAAIRAKAGI